MITFLILFPLMALFILILLAIIDAIGFLYTILCIDFLLIVVSIIVKLLT
mgnify:CR=1 FL=1